MADTKLIYDLLKEVRADQKKQVEKQGEQDVELAKQRTCLDSVQKHLKTIQKDVAENKEDWREHSRKTIALENLHQDNQKRIKDLEIQSKEEEKRIKKLEKPAIAKAWLKENLKWILAIGTLSVGLVTKLMDLW